MVTSASQEMMAIMKEDRANKGKAMHLHKMAEPENTALKMDRVLATITEIFKQIDLLALNATTEVTRAGAAGKGFLVGTNEIKRACPSYRDSNGINIVPIREYSRVNRMARSLNPHISPVSVNLVNEIVFIIASTIIEQSLYQLNCR